MIKKGVYKDKAKLNEWAIEEELGLSIKIGKKLWKSTPNRYHPHIATYINRFMRIAGLRMILTSHN